MLGQQEMSWNLGYSPGLCDQDPFGMEAGDVSVALRGDRAVGSLAP